MRKSDDGIKDPTTITALSGVHKRAILDCCFSLETDQILSGSEDKTLALWNWPATDTKLHDDTINDEHKLVCYRLTNHSTPVMSVAMHRRLFLSASANGLTNLWRLEKDPSRPASPDLLARREELLKPNPDPCTYNCHSTRIRSVCFSPDARCFATGSDDKAVKIWSTESKNKNLAHLPDGHKNWIKGVRWSKTNDSWLASCGDDSRICIWDARVRIRTPPALLVSAHRRFNCLDWHPIFGHHIATGGQDSSCIVWDLRNLKPVQIYMEHNDSVSSIAFNSGGSLLLSGSKDKTSLIFNVCEGVNMYKLMSHNAPVTSVCFSANDDLFATGSEDKTISVWRRNFDTIDLVADTDTAEFEDETGYERLDSMSSSSQRRHRRSQELY